MVVLDRPSRRKLNAELSFLTRHAPLVHNQGEKQSRSIQSLEHWSTLSIKLIRLFEQRPNPPSLISSDLRESTMAFLRQPVASTSRLPPHPAPSPPTMRSISTLPRSLRLTPSNRTRLTNLSFVTAALLSVLTVSLGMSGSVKVGGVGLPCPARREAGVAADSEGEWKVEGKKERRKRRWLEDPVPIARKDAVVPATTPASPRRQPRSAEVDESLRTQSGCAVEKRPVGRIAEEKEQSRAGWASWIKGVAGLS